MIVWQKSSPGYLGATVIVGKVFYFETWKQHRLWKLRITEITAAGDVESKLIGAHCTLQDAKRQAEAISLHIRYKLEAEHFARMDAELGASGVSSGTEHKENQQ